MYQRIVVPLDGSDIAELAIPDAERMARLTGAPMHLVRVVDPTQLPWYGAYADAMGATAVQGALGDEEFVSDSYLAVVTKRIAELGIEVDYEVQHGRVAKTLVAMAQPGDLFVMASHGRGGISRWLLGSVAEDLVRHAPVPVLLVKATAVVPVTPESDTDVARELETAGVGSYRGMAASASPDGTAPGP